MGTTSKLMPAVNPITPFRMDQQFTQFLYIT